MLEHFRTYRLAVNFYQAVKQLQLPCHLGDQLRRAASSIYLNLGEGYGRRTVPDKLRFYHIAFGSVRECQVICDIAPLDAELKKQCDAIAASLYCLIRVMRR